MSIDISSTPTPIPPNGPTAVVQTVSQGEQIAAAGIGLITAGPLGAAASWATIKGMQGKWTPWLLVGIVAAPVLGFAQFFALGLLGVGLQGVENAVQKDQSSLVRPVRTAPTKSTAQLLAESRQAMSEADEIIRDLNASNERFEKLFD